ncbi:MAG: histidine kinase, partial [Ferruginibacter sp.]|nr:histidine kinase [Ferruginibacter sp.]
MLKTRSIKVVLKEKPRLIKIYVVLVMVTMILPVLQINAQNFPDLKFTLLCKKNGLPTDLITNIFQDSRGLIWLGTENAGLLRYDGKKVKIFHDSKTIASNYTGTIEEDKGNWLWVSTSLGLYHFNSVTEECVLYSHNDSNEYSVGSNDKPKPFVDNKGRLWVTSTNGLQIFNPQKNIFIPFKKPPLTNPAWQQEYNHLGKMMEDSRGRIWIGSAYGLYLVDTAKRILLPYYTGLYATVTDIYEDIDKQIWVSFFGNGLKKFNPQNGKYTNVFGASAHVNSISGWEDDNKKKWICFSVNNSIVLLDLITNQFKQYENKIKGPFSLKGDDAGIIYKDRENRLWICTTAGVNLLDRNLQYFTNRLLDAAGLKNKQAIFGMPKAFLELENSYLVSSWMRWHLYEFDKNWNLMHIIRRIPPNSTSELSFGVNTIQQDEQGNTWYGTDSGLVRQSGSTYRCFIPDDDYPFEKNKYMARNIVKRSDGKYWCRFYSRGLYVFDAANGKFLKNYRQQFMGDAYTIVYDNTGQFWLGTQKGLYKYNQKLDSFFQIRIISNDKTEEDNYNWITQILFDKNNNGWLATQNGLIKMNPEKNTFQFIIDPAKPHVYRANKILMDSTGTLWIESMSEIIAYKPGPKQFCYFTDDNGLPPNFVGDFGLFNMLGNNEIVWGTSKIITTFSPYKLIGNMSAAPILFTDISIDGTRSSSMTDDSQENQKIIMEADSKILSLHFAFLNYTAPQQNKLFYRLSDERSNEWTETSDGNITFYGLAPGKYNLQIKAANISGMYKEANKQLTILVKPYWYQTFFFRISMLAFAVSIAYLFTRWRVNSAKTTAGQQKKITETEMAALKAQMNPHFMFNCINSIDSFIQTNDKYSATLY